jgi:signal peptidase I
MSIENNKLLSVVSELWSEADKKSVVKVSGISMRPLLLGGESILVDHTARDLKFGDIGVFSKEGMTMVHRVLSKKKVGGKTIYRTKGDWLLYMDDPFESSAIMGKVAFMTRKGKRFNLNRAGSTLYSRIMAFHSLMVVFIGKLFYLLDKSVDLFTRGSDPNRGNKHNRFFRSLFLYIDRFFHTVFHGVFFRLFHSVDKGESPF